MHVFPTREVASEVASDAAAKMTFKPDVFNLELQKKNMCSRKDPGSHQPLFYCFLIPFNVG